MSEDKERDEHHLRMRILGRRLTDFGDDLIAQVSLSKEMTARLECICDEYHKLLYKSYYRGNVFQQLMSRDGVNE